MGESKTILYSDKKIHYHVSGKGRPVMLIHGFGEDSSVWRYQTSFLEKKFRLMLPDLPGAGHSEMIDDMSMEGMAETIHAIIHAEDIDRCTIIGHSMGGYVLLALAEKYPNHVQAFGLFHSTAYPDTEEKKSTRRKGIAFIRQHGAFEFLKTTAPNLFSQLTRAERPQLIDEQVDLLRNFSPETLVSYYEAMMARPDRTALLKNAELPLLFILGETDGAVSLKDGLEQCHLPGKSYIHILHQSAHMGMMEEAGAANKILEKFLQETV